MKIVYEFEDGLLGNHIETDELRKDTIFSIVENFEGNFNLCPIYAGERNIAAGQKLFDKDYIDIEIIQVRDEYSIPNSNISKKQQLGLKCTLPNGKIELVYFYDSCAEMKYLFTEKDDIIDFEQVFLHYNETEENVYFIVKHSDGTKSLAFKDLLNKKENNELLYITYHAKKIKQNYKNKNILKIKEQIGENKISYLFNLLSLVKSNKRVKKCRSLNSNNNSVNSNNNSYESLPDSDFEFLDPDFNPEYIPDDVLDLLKFDPIEDDYLPFNKD